QRPNLRDESFDLLYVFFWGEDYYKKFSIRPEKIIKEVASHRWAFEEQYGKVSLEEFIATYLSDCSFVTTPSLRLFKMLKPMRDNVFHCPNGVDLKVFRHKRRRRGPLRIGWVGNPDDACKGLHDILIPVCKGRFEFSFSSGKWSRDRVARFYNETDVLAIASIAESQPMPFMESMACGCFPVTTDVGIVPEMIRDGFNGLVVERSIEAFYQAFEWCERNLDRVRRVGAYNAETCVAMRSWDNLIDNFVKVFNLAMQIETLEAPERFETASVASVSAPAIQEVQGGLQAHGEDYAVHLELLNPGTTDEKAYLASVSYYHDELKPLLPTDRQSMIVDIGTGYGHLLRYLLENGYVNVGGIDNSSKLIREAKSYLKGGPLFLIHTGAVEFLLENPAGFDVIVLFDVIEHFSPEEQREVVSAIFSSLSPGGRVIIRTPNMASLLGTYSRYLDLTHYLGFTEFSLYQLLRQCGFKDPKLYVASPHGTWKKRFQKKLLRWLHRKLFEWQDRVLPDCYDKNIVVWAEKNGGVYRKMNCEKRGKPNAVYNGSPEDSHPLRNGRL
ncbi:MAG: methyltransferase domain-containing protein, partial [Deltaproteobacteria bacterium]|nr:methyltransferase domain-containing protein [Deltaproteobacteria bacterium]